MRTNYTKDHAQAGVNAKLPVIECWENQYHTGYSIHIVEPEFTSICPKTGLPDFGTITIDYQPADLCVELKSLKMYFNAYRDLGIFNENVANKILEDLVRACKPSSMRVRADFNPRGGIATSMLVEYPVKDN
jgi:7-cyano-7-deazaguanine reductase